MQTFCACATGRAEPHRSGGRENPGAGTHGTFFFVGSTLYGVYQIGDV